MTGCVCVSVSTVAVSNWGVIWGGFVRIANNDRIVASAARKLLSLGAQTSSLPGVRHIWGHPLIMSICCVPSLLLPALIRRYWCRHIECRAPPRNFAANKLPHEWTWMVKRRWPVWMTPRGIRNMYFNIKEVLFVHIFCHLCSCICMYIFEACACLKNAAQPMPFKFHIQKKNNYNSHYIFPLPTSSIVDLAATATRCAYVSAPTIFSPVRMRSFARSLLDAFSAVSWSQSCAADLHMKRTWRGKI